MNTISTQPDKFTCTGVPAGILLFFTIIFLSSCTANAGSRHTPLEHGSAKRIQHHYYPGVDAQYDTTQHLYHYPKRQSRRQNSKAFPYPLHSNKHRRQPLHANQYTPWKNNHVQKKHKRNINEHYEKSHKRHKPHGKGPSVHRQKKSDRHARNNVSSSRPSDKNVDKKHRVKNRNRPNDNQHNTDRKRKKNKMNVNVSKKRNSQRSTSTVKQNRQKKKERIKHTQRQGESQTGKKRRIRNNTNTRQRVKKSQH